MNEGDLKSQLMEKLRTMEPSFIAWRIEDKLTAGIPDIHVAACGRGSYWEVKFDDDDGFTSNGAQELMMLRLAGATNRAFYVIYSYKSRTGLKFTKILHPKDFKNWQFAGETRPGWDHKWVVEAIRGVHRV